MEYNIFLLLPFHQSSVKFLKLGFLQRVAFPFSRQDLFFLTLLLAFALLMPAPCTTAACGRCKGRRGFCKAGHGSDPAWWNLPGGAG